VTTQLATRPARRGFSAVPVLGDFVALARLLRDRRAPWAPKIVALLALAYVISPADAIPEAIAPMIGWLDDVGLLLALRLFLDGRLSKYRYPLFEPAPTAKPTPTIVDAELVPSTGPSSG
jgi:uncharacterized membrane protein YkvA (DUF1232 family)